jgi:threonine/homoserine/homoserine lactone efflux protein
VSLDFPARYPEYLVAAMVIILAPGPSVLFIIARAIAWGRATAVATVAGNVTGAFTLSLMVAFGLGPILQRSEIAFITVQLLGGLYLIYLGVDAIKHSKIHAADMVNQGDLKPSPLKSAKDGFWVGALNPKGLVFFAAILPQFIDKGSTNVTSQLVLMGATFAVLAFFSDGTWGLIAGTVREWMATTPVRLVTMRRIGGLVMIILGIFTLISAL